MNKIEEFLFVVFSFLISVAGILFLIWLIKLLWSLIIK